MRLSATREKNSLLFSLLSQKPTLQLTTGSASHSAVLRPLQEVAFARLAQELVALDHNTTT